MSDEATCVCGHPRRDHGPKTPDGERGVGFCLHGSCCDCDCLEFRIAPEERPNPADRVGEGEHR